MFVPMLYCNCPNVVLYLSQDCIVLDARLYCSRLNVVLYLFQCCIVFVQRLYYISPNVETTQVFVESANVDPRGSK